MQFCWGTRVHFQAPCSLKPVTPYTVSLFSLRIVSQIQNQGGPADERSAIIAEMCLETRLSRFRTDRPALIVEPTGGKETICPGSQWSGWTTWDLTSSVSQNVWRRRAAGGAVVCGWIPYLSGGGLVVRGVWPLSVPSPPASRRRPLRRSRREKASAGRKLLQANSRFATRSRCLGHGIADVWSSSGRFRYQSSSTFPVWKGKKKGI